MNEFFAFRWSARLTTSAALALSLMSSLTAIHAADWPQFLGPARNGSHLETDLARGWPKAGPTKLWQATIGQGFSGPVVAEGKLILFHRLNQQEIVQCFDAKTGGGIWQFGYPATYRDDFGFDEGPRSTPAIGGGAVVTFGADGVLHCLEFATGRKMWSVDAKKEFGARKGFFGFACSPLLDSGKIFLNLGGADGAGIVAFDQTTGKVLWTATDHEASYSSPVMAKLGGQRDLLCFTRNGLVALEPNSGRAHAEFPWRSRTHASVNAATPLVVGDDIFLSASYDTGGVLLHASAGQLSKIWTNDDALSIQYATAVQRDGFLYGYHGRQDAGRMALRCVEWKSGRIKWSEDNFGAGTVTLASDRLLLLKEDGRLIAAEATPEKFKLVQEAQILPSGVRAFPALADALFYARGKDRLVCVDLRESAAR